MANNNASPLDAHGIALITDLVKEAAAVDIRSISVSGLGAGLPSSVPVGFDRKEQEFKSVRDLIEEYRQAPARRRGTAKVDTLRSFIDLTNRHKDEQSALFGKASWPEPKLTAVLNYDSEGNAARYGDHRVEYAFPLTEEFKVWTSMNGKPMAQDAFALFIEEHAAELAEPTPAEVAEFEPLFKERFASPSEVLMLSRELEVYSSAKAKQGIRLASGERVLEFSEEHTNRNGEKVTIPGIFMVSVPAFVNGANVRIPARLRYRLGPPVTWFYQLYRWEAFLRDEVQRALGEAAEATALPAFDGAPEGKAA